MQVQLAVRSLTRSSSLLRCTALCRRLAGPIGAEDESFDLYADLAADAAGSVPNEGGGGGGQPDDSMEQKVKSEPGLAMSSSEVSKRASALAARRMQESAGR